MKWRLSKEKNELELEKTTPPPTSYLEHDGIIISGNRVTSINIAAATATSKPIDHHLGYESNGNGHASIAATTHSGKLFPFEEVMHGDTNKKSPKKHDNIQSMYVMASKHLSNKNEQPWMTSTSAHQHQMTTKNSRGSPMRHNVNLSSTMLDNYTGETTTTTTNNDFHYINQHTTTRNPSNTESSIQNGSTTKLIPMSDDQSAKQTKCSIVRGFLLCLCLNVTYANIVRFPRELEKHGCAFLVPYFIFLLLVGLPIILLEVSIGQFLGQGAANSWKASPIMKGACIVGRIASCLGAIWVSLEAVIALVYIVLFTYKRVPFSECVSGVRISETGYSQQVYSGGHCLERTILSPVWDNAFYFALLAGGLAFMWIFSVICAHNAKTFRRSTYVIGLVGFVLLLALTGIEIEKFVRHNYFPGVWIFNETLFAESTIWFDGLIQVLFATYIGVGAIPVMTGSYLYKGDAVRTSIVYVFLNLLINAFAVVLFMVQFDNDMSRNYSELSELKGLIAIYDTAQNSTGLVQSRVIPGLTYGMIVISAIITTSIAVYSVSKLLPRYFSYLLGLIALSLSIIALFCPYYKVARVLDSRIVGTLIIIALVFDIIATIWVYGGKNIYLDLEFAIGRPITKLWLGLWYIGPVILTGILVWWCVGDDEFDLLATYIPRWAPIIVAIVIIVSAAIAEISKQVDYNFFGMICEAAKAQKEWGPTDPLARHSWKQWRSVCQDTGQKDFTLRRRGTRDYTHSIKRGQYSTNNKYNVHNWKNSTTGTNSPNYSGSMFGDSAIEEDFSVGKYSNGIDVNSMKPMRHSSRLKYASRNKRHDSDSNHREILYVRRLSTDSNNKTTITITPTADIVTYPRDQTRGGRSSTASPQREPHHDADSDHFCWRKFSANSEEYSTEL